jgi:hypothetical protein
MVVVPVPISAAFRLESSPDPLKLRAEAAEHVFDHVVRSNKKDSSSNFSRQVAITQVPGKAHQLNRIFVSDFDSIFGSG